MQPMMTKPTKRQACVIGKRQKVRVNVRFTAAGGLTKELRRWRTAPKRETTRIHGCCICAATKADALPWATRGGVRRHSEEKRENGR